jgi:uncharacterized membrane protein YbhN (UPF0104 family)/RimJ/RimL family protein N-acetyltransferase
VKASIRRHLGNLLKIGVSVGLLAWVLPRIGLDEIWYEMRAAHWGWLGAAFVLFVVSTALRAFRWQALLRGLALSVPTGRLIKLYFVGAFFNTFLPSGFGGDVVRVIELAQDSRCAHEAAGTVLVDRLSGILVLLALALLAVPFSLKLISSLLAVGIAALAVGGLAGGWLLFQQRLLGRVIGAMPQGLPFGLKNQVAKLYAAICGSGSKAVRQALAISLAFNALLILINYLLALSLNVQVSIGYFLLFVPLTSLSLMLPAVGGLGVREYTYQVLWPQAGISPTQAVAMSLLNYAITAATGLIGGAIYAGENLLALIRRPSSLGDKPKPAPSLKPHQVVLEGQTPQGRLIRLRPMTEDDWGILLKWNNDPEVLYYAEGDDIAAYSLERVQALYRSVCQNAICFIIEANGRPIGECWLQKMNIERVLKKYPTQDCRRIDLAIGNKQYWDQGIGTEVIRLLTEFGFLKEKADVIFEPSIADHNLRSLRAFQKAGYEIAGKIQQKPGQKTRFEYDLVLTKERFLEGLATPGSSEAEPA